MRKNSPLKTVWYKTWSDGRYWGYLRLLLALLLIVLLIRFGHLIYLDPRLHPAVLSLRGLRYVIFPLAAFFGAMLLAGYYVKDIYELPSVRHALRYLWAALFSIRHPRLQIKDGKKQIEPGETNLIEIIGGPGYVNIAPGSVALVERKVSPSNVYGAGSHYLNRWERLREISSLNDQHGFIEEIKAVTREGVEVIVKDVHFRYRLHAAREAGDYMQRSPEQPYPFSISAMRAMTYHRSVGTSGVLSLEDVVRGVIRIVISGFVQRQLIDRLTAPEKDIPDPRLELRNQFFSAPIRKRFRFFGVDLLWVDIGHFSIAGDEVDLERVNLWGAKWEGLAQASRSYAEGVRLSNQEIGRAQAQADLLHGILQSVNEALKDAKTQEERNQILRKLLLARTAQILDAWAQTNPKAEEERQLPPRLRSEGHKP